MTHSTISIQCSIFNDPLSIGACAFIGGDRIVLNSQWIFSNGTNETTTFECALNMHRADYVFYVIYSIQFYCVFVRNVVRACTHVRIGSMYLLCTHKLNVLPLILSLIRWYENSLLCWIPRTHKNKTTICGIICII